MKSIKEKILLDDNATYAELLEGLRAVTAYGDERWKAVERYLNRKELNVMQTVWTPSERSFPGLYVYRIKHGKVGVRIYLELDSKEGTSYAMVQYPEDEADVEEMTRTKRITLDPKLNNEEDFIIEVLHGHAVKRYIERHGWSQGYHSALKHIFDGINGQSLQPDPTDDTYYLYFDGGVFLGQPTDGERVIHLRTFIMNRQCYPVQRMKSLQSEQERQLYMEKFGKEIK